MTSSDDQAPEQSPETPAAPEQPGYWESQASAGAPDAGAQFNPQSAYPSHQAPNQPPAGYPAPGQQYPPPYGQPAYPQYGQPQYPQPPYGQPQYGYPGYPVYGPPEHPRTNLAFVLGLVGGPGAFATCGLSLLAAPFAWYFAVMVRRELAAAPGRYSADTSKVTAGLILGIIGTALLALAFVLIAILIVVAIADPSAFDDSTTV